MLKNDVTTYTHTGLKTQFNLHFIKTGIIEKEFGKLYADLMDWRQKGDYGDMFDFSEKTEAPLLKPVEQFLTKVEELIK